MSDVWFEITNGTYKGFDFHIANPIKGGNTHGVTNIQQVRARRLQVIKRPFVDGGRTKDLGADPGQITVDVIFFGDNYLQNLKEFESVLNDGESGKLLLPDEPESLWATFQRIDKTSRSGETRSKTVRVTWIEDAVVEATDQASGPAVGIIEKTIVDASNDMTAFVAKANEVLNNNKIIDTVRKIESVTGNASNAFINAVGLTDQVRGRILTTVANLTNSFNTITAAKDQLLSIFGVADSRGSGFAGGVVDPVTGNTVESLSGDQETVVEVDPLAAPDLEPDASVEIQSVETAENLNTFRDDMIAFLEDQTEQLGQDTGGRTDDVTQATIDVTNSLRDLIQVTTPAPPIFVQTPVDLSLAEVLFHHGIDLQNIEDVYRRNTAIDDILDIPRGTVIEL